MVSFRFYLVSITAVFLALAVGITMGATVIDAATVDALRAQIRRVEARVSNTDGQNSELNRRLQRYNDFEDQAAAALVKDRLTGVPVVVVGVRGADRDVVDSLRQLVVAAGAKMEGTVWFTTKLMLDKPEDVTALATALGVFEASPDAVRTSALRRLSQALAGADVKSPLPVMRELGFVDYEAAETKDLTTIPEVGSRFLVVSNTQPDVPDEQLAVPFAAELARDTTDRVVAAEPGRDARNKQPELRETFVGPLRTDPTVKDRLSSVDNIEDVRGRVVTVYALQNLSAGKLGHFGYGPHVDRLSPEP
jgi:hypothetical protein